MSNQLPINPVPTSPLSLGQETNKKSSRVLEIDDSFHDELTDVLSSVAEPLSKPRPEESKISDDRDQKVEESEVEKNKRNPDSEDSPSDETNQMSESKSTVQEAEDPENSLSLEESIGQAEGIDNPFNLTHIVDKPTITATETLIDSEVVAENAEQLNQFDKETVHVEVGNTKHTAVEEGSAVLEQAEVVDPLASEVDTLTEKAGLVVEGEPTIGEVSSDETEIATDTKIDVAEEVSEISESQASSATNSAAPSSVASQASESSSPKKNEASTSSIELVIQSSPETTESLSTDEPLANQPNQATSTDSQALDSSVEFDTTIEPEAIDDSAAGEIENQNSTGNRQVDQLSESRTSRQTDTGAPRVDPTRFVSRVAKAFESAQQKGGPIEIRLSPPELGSLQVRLEVKEGVLTASLETENQAARNAILDNLPALRERLAEQQIRIEKFDVDVRDDSNPSDGWQQQSEEQGDREAQADRDRHAPLPESNQEAESGENTQATSTIQLPNNGINLVA